MFCFCLLQRIFFGVNLFGVDERDGVGRSRTGKIRWDREERVLNVKLFTVLSVGQIRRAVMVLQFSFQCVKFIVLFRFFLFFFRIDFYFFLGFSLRFFFLGKCFFYFKFFKEFWIYRDLRDMELGGLRLSIILFVFEISVM